MEKEEEILHLKLQLESERNRRIDVIETKLENLNELLIRYRNDTSASSSIEGETLSKLRLKISDCQSQLTSLKEKNTKESLTLHDQITKVEQQATAIGNKMDTLRETIVAQAREMAFTNEKDMAVKEKLKSVNAEVTLLQQRLPVQNNQIESMTELIGNIRSQIEKLSGRISTIEESMPLLNLFKDRLNMIFKSVLSFAILAIVSVVVWAIREGATML